MLSDYVLLVLLHCVWIKLQLFAVTLHRLTSPVLLTITITSVMLANVNTELTKKQLEILKCRKEFNLFLLYVVKYIWISGQIKKI